MSVLLPYLAATVATYLFARTLRMGPIGATAAAHRLFAQPALSLRAMLHRADATRSLDSDRAADDRAGVAQSPRMDADALLDRHGIVIWQMIAGYFGKGMYYGILLLGAYLAYRTLIDPPTPQSNWKRRIGDFALNAAMVLGLGAGFSAIVAACPGSIFSTTPTQRRHLRSRRSRRGR